MTQNRVLAKCVSRLAFLMLVNAVKADTSMGSSRVVKMVKRSG